MQSRVETGDGLGIRDTVKRAMREIMDVMLDVSTGKIRMFSNGKNVCLMAVSGFYEI